MMRSVLLFGFLASCGPLNQGSPPKAIAGQVFSQIRGEAPAEQPLITEELAQADEFLFVTIRLLGAVIPMSPAAQTGDVQTWIAPTGATVALENEILVATRGLGFDVSGIDPIGTRAAIVAGGGSSSRTHGFLTPTDQIDTLRMDCTVTQVGSEDVDMPRGTVSLTKFEEECSSPRLIFQNEYWTDDDGDIVRSLQMLSPELGFLLLERA